MLFGHKEDKIIKQIAFCCKQNRDYVVHIKRAFDPFCLHIQNKFLRVFSYVCLSMQMQVFEKADNKTLIIQ
jgi:hypothetical protein